MNYCQTSGHITNVALLVPCVILPLCFNNSNGGHMDGGATVMMIQVNFG